MRQPGQAHGPATLVLASRARSRSCASVSGGTLAPDLARLRSGTKINAACPAEHITANRRRGRAARNGRGHTDGMRARGSVLAFQERSGGGLELLTACIADGTASDIAATFSLQIAEYFRVDDASKTRIRYPQIAPSRVPSPASDEAISGWMEPRLRRPLPFQLLLHVDTPRGARSKDWRTAPDEAPRGQCGF